MGQPGKNCLFFKQLSPKFPYEDFPSLFLGYICKMNTDHILNAYQKSETLVRLNNYLNNQNRATLRGLLGSQSAMLMLALAKLSEKPMLILAEDKEEAAYLQNDLATLLERGEALLFPDSYRRPKGFDKLNRSAVLQRTETIGRLSMTGSSFPIIVTYPEAVFEKIVAPESLEQSVIKVKVGEKLDVKFMVEVLVDYGFEFDYSSKTFSTTWGIDEDGDFSESALEDEMTFSNDQEMIVYMANCLVVKLQDKI
jgi:transcription-repair coupling factor (superfamily II helicase)